MSKEIISTFREKPKNKMGWWAFGLAMIIVFSGPILGMSAALLVPLVSNNVSERVGSIVGGSVGFLAVAAYITALVLSIKSYRHGERSWAVMTALAISILVSCFWVFLLVGELAFPH